jgi:hypothetical protein
MSRKKKSKRVFAFTTPLPPADLKQKLREAVYNDGSLLYEDTPNGFNLGIERGGHSGGYWYTATLTETEDGTEMRGEIVYRSLHGDGSYREATKWEKVKETLFVILVGLLCLIPILIIYAIQGILRLIGKLRGKPLEITLSTEEKLTHFMTEVMGCNTIE